MALMLLRRVTHGAIRGLILASVAMLVVACESETSDSSRGRVAHVFDGDSLVVSYPGATKLEVRLAEIDAPERGQPHADAARSALVTLIGGDRVRLEIQEQDRYGRAVARVYRDVDGLDVNAEMVRRGHAWAYRRYLRDEHLLALESEARGARRGLWSSPERDITPPWRWREQQRERR